MHLCAGMERGSWLLLGLAVAACGSPPTPVTGEGSSTGAADGTTTFDPPSDEAGSGQVLTTGTPGSSSSGGGSMDGSDDVSFLLEPDGGGDNECDPTAQDCPRGQKCTAWANDGGTFWNATRCVEVAGGNVAGDSCMVEGNGVSGIDDCDVGHICLNTNEENVGVCVAFCEGEDLE